MIENQKLNISFEHRICGLQEYVVTLDSLHGRNN